MFDKIVAVAKKVPVKHVGVTVGITAVAAGGYYGYKKVRDAYIAKLEEVADQVIEEVAEEVQQD